MEDTHRVGCASAQHAGSKASQAGADMHGTVCKISSLDTSGSEKRDKDLHQLKEDGRDIATYKTWDSGLGQDQKNILFFRYEVFSGDSR